MFDDIKNLSFRDLAFIDTETTGLSSDDDRVIEIAVIRIRDGEPIDEFHTMVNPQKLINREQLKISGILNRDLVSAPTFAELAPNLRKILRNAVFVAHNVEFDYGFISAEFLRIGEPYQAQRLCTVELSRTIYPDYQRHGLDAIAARHNLQIAARHRAMDDTKATWEFFKIAKQYYGEENFMRAVASLLKAPKQTKLATAPRPQLGLF
jgi:DNA polymerase III subunit epsilon